MYFILYYYFLSFDLQNISNFERRYLAPVSRAGMISDEFIRTHFSKPIDLIVRCKVTIVENRNSTHPSQIHSSQSLYNFYPYVTFNHSSNPSSFLVLRPSGAICFAASLTITAALLLKKCNNSTSEGVGRHCCESYLPNKNNTSYNKCYNTKCQA